MAEQNILSVSLNGYKEKIGEITSALGELKNSSEEYKRTVEKLNEAQDALTRAFEETNSAINKNSASYSSIVDNINIVKSALLEASTSLNQFSSAIGEQQITLSTDSLVESINEIKSVLSEASESLSVFISAIGEQEISLPIEDVVSQVEELKTSLGGISEEISNNTSFSNTIDNINALGSALSNTIANISTFASNIGKTEVSLPIDKLLSQINTINSTLTSASASLTQFASTVNQTKLSLPIDEIVSQINDISAQLEGIDVTEAIDGLAESFEGVDEALTQHIEVINEVNSAQNTFNETLSETDTSNAETSYDSLMEQLKQLRESLAEASSEADRSNIGESIANIAQQLSQFDGATSLKEFKAEIEELKASLLGLEQGSQGYNAVLEELREKQDNLNKSLTDAKYGAENADGSYNALVATMSNLRKAWKETNDEVERVELGKKILEINNQLKQLDASIGNFQRNVGDYANQMQSAFNSMGGSIGKTTSSIMGIGKSIKALAASNPEILAVVAVMAVLSEIAQQVKKAIEGDEELTNRFSEAMATFEPIVLAVKEAFAQLAELFVQYAEFVAKVDGEIINLITHLTDWLGWTNKANESVKRSIELKKEENKLDREKRANNIQISEIQQTMAEREEKIALARRTNTKEYKRLMAEQRADQEKINALTVETAKKELELAQQRAALSRNSKADNDALAKAQIAYNNAISQGQKALAALTKQEQRVASSGGGKTKEDIAIERLEKYIAKLKETSDEEERFLNLQIKLQGQLNELDAKNGEKYEETVRKHRDLLLMEYNTIGKTLTNLEAQENDAIERIKKELKIGQEEIKKLQNASPNDEGWTKKEIEAIKILNDYKKKSVELNLKLNDAWQQVELFDIDEINKKNEREFQSSLSKVEHDLERALKDFQVRLQQADLTFKPTFNVKELWEKFDELKAVQIQYNEEVEKNGEESAKRMYGKQLEELKATTPKFLQEYNDIFKSVEGDYAIQFNKDEIDNYAAHIADAIAEVKTKIDDLQNNESDGFFIDYDKEEERLKELSDLIYQYDVLTLDYTNATQRMYYQDLIDEQQKYLNKLKEQGKEGSDEYLQLQQEIHDLEYEMEFEHTQRILELYDLKKDKEKEDTEVSKKHAADVKKSYLDLSKSVGSLMGGIASIMEANIDQKVKNGEISEEEAEKEFERVKKVQLAELWVNTLAGAGGAFLQDMKTYPSPYNYIIAGIDFSTAMLQGITQTKAIQQQQYGGGTSGGDSSAVAQVEAVSVNPLLNEAIDSQLMSTIDTNEALGSMTDSRVYILQSDITESNKQVQIRQSNTSF